MTNGNRSFVRLVVGNRLLRGCQWINHILDLCVRAILFLCQFGLETCLYPWQTLSEKCNSPMSCHNSSFCFDKVFVWNEERGLSLSVSYLLVFSHENSIIVFCESYPFISSISTWNGLVTNSLHGHSIITTTVSPTAKRPTISLRPVPSMNPPESQRPISSIEPDSTLNPVRPTPFSDSVESDNKSSTMSRSMHPLDSEQLERILHLLTDGNATTPNRIIYFSPNGWGGFCNSFRAIRSLALYSLLYGFKLRSMVPCVRSMDSSVG